MKHQLSPGKLILFFMIVRRETPHERHLNYHHDPCTTENHFLLCACCNLYLLTSARQVTLKKKKKKNRVSKRRGLGRSTSHHAISTQGREKISNRQREVSCNLITEADHAPLTHLHKNHCVRRSVRPS